jgi:signal transduction histidine kinase
MTLAFAIVVSAAIGLAAAEDYQRSLRAAEQRSLAASRLLAEHARHTFEASDRVLDRVIERLAQSGPGTFNGSHGLAALKELASQLPEQGSVAIIDGQGILRLSTKWPEPVAVSVSDRTYWLAHQQGVDLVIGPLIRDRLNNRLIYTVSRALRGPNGEVLAVVVAGVDPAILTDFFWRDAGSNMAIGLYGPDGSIVLREPLHAEDVGRNIGSSPLFALARTQDEGTYRTNSAIDGKNRIAAFAKVPGQALYAGASIPAAKVFAECWRRLLRNSLIGLAALAGLAGLAQKAMRAERAAKAKADQAALACVEALAAKAETERANAAKAKFFAAASHDMRQPAQALTLLVEILRPYLVSPQARKAGAAMEQATQAMQGLLDTLLEVSRLDAGMVTPCFTHLSPARIIDRLVEDYAPQAAAKGLTLRKFTAGGQAYSDPALLERILRNLLENALRYTEQGGILIGCRRRGAGLAITIADTGQGIPEDQQESVFEEFIQLANPARDRRLGLGLGLSIVRRLAQLLDAEVTLRSIPGRGTVVTVALGVEDVAVGRQVAHHDA